MADWNRDDDDYANRDFGPRPQWDEDRDRDDWRMRERSNRDYRSDFGGEGSYRSSGSYGSYLGGGGYGSDDDRERYEFEMRDGGYGAGNLDRDYGLRNRDRNEQTDWRAQRPYGRDRESGSVFRDDSGSDRPRGDYTAEGFGYAGGNIGGGYGTIGGGGGTGLSRDYGVGQGGYSARNYGRDFGTTEGYGSFDRTRDIGRHERQEPGVWQRIKSSFRGKGPKGYRRSDERIRETVSERLEDDHDVDASDIEVRVADGVVTLTGTVRDRWQKRRAEDIVETLGGVRDVQNELRLANDAGDSDSAPAASGRTTGVTSTGITGTTETGGTARNATTPGGKPKR
jgi:hypothetical protein